MACELAEGRGQGLEGGMGQLGKLGIVIQEERPGPLPMEEAFCPWAVAVRRYTVRVGRNPWPLVGIGRFIVASRALSTLALLHISEPTRLLSTSYALFCL